MSPVEVFVGDLIDPEAWLRARGWMKFERSRGGDPYWRKTPNEPGWEGGWDLGGAVHMELERENRELLIRMGLYRPPTRMKQRRRA